MAFYSSLDVDPSVLTYIRTRRNALDDKFTIHNLTSIIFAAAVVIPPNGESDMKNWIGKSRKKIAVNLILFLVIIARMGP